MPLVVVIGPSGCCVEDVLGPWCVTRVSHMSRCARATVQREEQHGMVHMSPKRWRTTAVQASSFLVQHGGSQCEVHIGVRLV